MLPEINRLRVFEKKNCSSIYEYAAKFAGISNAQVDTVLRLERRFEDKPALKNALVNGEVSHHKLVRVASIATKENEEELAEKSRTFSKSALETLVKDEKQNTTVKPLFNDNSMPGHRIELSEEVHEKLYQLQQKGHNVNGILLELLKKREEKIAEEKEKLSREATPTQSRYMKMKIKKVVRAEHGTKCSIPDCNKDAKIIHHTQRFSISKTHEPKYLAPLCKEHHEIAHSVDNKYNSMRTGAR